MRTAANVTRRDPGAMQADIFADLLPPVQPASQPGDTIDDAFRRFHEANPHVYRLLLRLARQAIASGREQIGIGMLFEVLRWNYLVWTDGADFKLNNNFRSRYARLLDAREPELRGRFELRALRSE